MSAVRLTTTSLANADGINANQLRLIADALERLASIPIDVEIIEIGGLTLRVKRHSSQREGDWYTVTEIERDG